MVFGKRYNIFYIRYGGWLLLGILALIVVDFGQLKVPELYRMVVNGMNSGTVLYNMETVPFNIDFLLDNICRPLLIVVFFICVGRFAWRVCFFGASIKMGTDLRQDMFDHCKDLTQEYYQVNKVGDIMSLFTNDLDTIQDCFGNGVLIAADAIALGLMAFVKMLRMNHMLTALSMIPMIALFAMATIIGRKMKLKWAKRQEAFSALSDFSQESFSGIAVIKSFAKEYKELTAFRKLNIDNEDANVSFTRTSTLLRMLFFFFVESVICVILGYGGFLVYKGIFSAGELVEFITYFTSIIWPIEAVSMIIDMTARAAASSKRIDDFMASERNVKDKEGIDNNLVDITGKIEFRNLSFAYPGTDIEVLKDISFIINSGEMVGIVGKTGSGKTTLVDLIERTYNVPQGSLLVDGVDVNDIPINHLRANIAYVPQDNFLFSDTIAENVAFSCENKYEIADVEKASKLAGIHENIMEFPAKYDTVLGERGVTVSGGQKQRISIARAFMKDSKILILDDSVSAVDTKTEKTILDNIRTTRQGKTTILIAHRISTVESMDKILFIDDGKVVDFGRHEELLERCPLYAKSVELQRLEDSRKERGSNA